MLLIKTYRSGSTIHGLGLFATHDIPQGTLVWQFDNGFDRTFSRERILDFPPHVQRFLYPNMWRGRSGSYHHFSDAAYIINHSTSPNLRRDDHLGKKVAYACKHIFSGTELTWDYRRFDFIDQSADNLWKELSKKLNIEYDEHLMDWLNGS
jgi:SET domain-containing protein